MHARVTTVTHTHRFCCKSELALTLLMLVMLNNTECCMPLYVAEVAHIAVHDAMHMQAFATTYCISWNAWFAM
jgi:hypothetical protein